MTLDELKRKFPNASAAFLAENTGKNAKLERLAGNEPLAQDKGEEGTARRLHVRFTSRRKRLCDPDNLSPKWLLDCLRYCGAIEGDEPEKITLEVRQEKVGKGEPEETLIEIYQLPTKEKI